MIHQLKAEGLNHSQIARRLGVDRKTVRRYLRFDDDDAATALGRTRPSKLDPYRDYLFERVERFPQLSATRLLREIRELGYSGQLTILRDYLRQIRPAAQRRFEIRFETPPGEQAQVDFACFPVRFGHEPEHRRVVWLFSMVLGYSILADYVHTVRPAAEVEVSVQIVERWILARLQHCQFCSLAQLNASIKELLEELNRKLFKQMPGNRFDTFKRFEQPALRALPQRLY